MFVLAAKPSLAADFLMQADLMRLLTLVEAQQRPPTGHSR